MRVRTIWTATILFIIRLVLVICFWIVAHLLNVVRIDGKANIAQREPTYYALQHKRDDDPFFVLPALLLRRGSLSLARSIHFGLRADAFARGFLARLVESPRWFAFLLFGLNVGPILAALGAHPLFAIQQSPHETWLRLARARDGDRPVAETLDPALIDRLAEASHIPASQLATLSIQDLLQWHFQRYLQAYGNADLFAEPYRHAIAHHSVELLRDQLADLADLLRHGAALLGAPEGELTPDGRIGQVSSAFTRILHLGPPRLTVVPISTTYDTMTARRMKVFITIGAPLHFEPREDRQRVERALRQAWLAGMTFTSSHLGCIMLKYYAAVGHCVFSTEQFVRDVRDLANHLAAQGYRVDDQLRSAILGNERQLAFLRFVRRRGYVRLYKPEYWAVLAHDETIHVEPGQVGYRTFPLAYTWNEVEEMIGARSRGDEAALSPILRWLYESTGVVIIEG